MKQVTFIVDDLLEDWHQRLRSQLGGWLLARVADACPDPAVAAELRLGAVPRRVTYHPQPRAAFSPCSRGALVVEMGGAEWLVAVPGDDGPAALDVRRVLGLLEWPYVEVERSRQQVLIDELEQSGVVVQELRIVPAGPSRSERRAQRSEWRRRQVQLARRR